VAVYFQVAEVLAREGVARRDRAPLVDRQPRTGRAHRRQEQGGFRTEARKRDLYAVKVGLRRSRLFDFAQADDFAAVGPVTCGLPVAGDFKACTRSNARKLLFHVVARERETLL
jgi:hypothetical protein